MATNIAILTGRLTRDPDVRYTSGNEPKAVANFTLAVNRMKEGADFISCTAFGKTAEFMEKYIQKGSAIEVVGRIQTGSYEKDGVKHYTTTVIADRVNFSVGSKKEDSGTATTSDDVPTGFSEVDIDIPF